MLDDFRSSYFRILKEVVVLACFPSAENHQLISQPCHLTALWKEKGGGAEIMTYAWSLEIAGKYWKTQTHMHS